MRVRPSVLELGVSLRPVSAIALAMSMTACGGEGSPDAGVLDGATADVELADGGPGDGGDRCLSMHIPAIVLRQPFAGLRTGTGRDVPVEFARDPACEVTVSITASTPGIVTFPETLAISRANVSTSIRLTAQAVGSTTLTLTAVGGVNTVMATLAVDVVDGTMETCTGTASGMVTAGGELAATSGTIASARIALPAGASRDDDYHVNPFAASIACADDAIPAGYLALGPAVSFTSAAQMRFPRELDFTVPISLALLPDGANRAHVEFVYSGPSVTPRIVPITSPIFEGGAADGTVRFAAPRLGTYRAVVRADAPHRRQRRFTHRGILGFSMGGSGTGNIGVGHPDLFDFIAPLGGPTDWGYLTDYTRRYHLGGFCTLAEREADLADNGTLDTCNVASLAHAPLRGQLFEHVQHYENWWYEDDYDGQGGTFNRSDYLTIFRDLTHAFGNANTDTSNDGTLPSLLPPGMPTDRIDLPNSARCTAANRVTIAPEPMGGDTNPATGWFDDEYNPAGRYPVISFCDGAERTRPDGVLDVGNWDPTGNQFQPVDVAFAVDYDDDGIRDPGEPVIRNGAEPFDDFGCDATPSAMEAGYHQLTNPDPAGDDYDFQYNPTGTEGNWDHDDAQGRCTGTQHEDFEDVGIDGVASTAQVGAGGYDAGEGDGHFTRTYGAARMISTSPRARMNGYYDRNGTWVPGYSDEVIDGFDFLADGGIRDLFNWAVMGNHATGAFSARQRPVRFYNGHGALHMDGRGDDTFQWGSVPWDEIGRYAMVRYGSIDASEEQRVLGDGGHVGTVIQIRDRIFAALALMSARWPGGSRNRVFDTVCSEPSDRCPANQLHVQNTRFTAPTTGREGPVSIVLPPGYFQEESADTCYPVVYILHGYGMDPQSLTALGLFMWNYMNAPDLNTQRRVQKMIFVFPDGQCSGNECARGTFYANAPANHPHGAQIETFMLDLMQHVDDTYRTCGVETLDVVE